MRKPHLLSHALAAYLHFGYIPQSDPTLPVNIANAVASHAGPGLDSDAAPQPDTGSLHAAAEIEALAQAGASALRQALKQEADGLEKRTHVVPLSGGLDSRAILGGVLENVPGGRVQTVTFGTPGSYDYEIGRQVANAAGVANVAIDLTSSEWTWSTQELAATAAHSARPCWLFECHVNRHIPTLFGQDAIYWSGFMGDPVAGSHLLNPPSASWAGAVEEFLARNRYANVLQFAPDSFDPACLLPTEPFCAPDALTYDEQLDFVVRQQDGIAPLVMAVGFDYRTPFENSDWVAFMLNQPATMRLGQKLYIRVLQTAYPALFALPTKLTYGYPLDTARWRILARRVWKWAGRQARQWLPWTTPVASPVVNYIDYAQALRRSGDFQSVVRENLADLERRNLIPRYRPLALLERHLSSRENLAKELLLLAGLEIYLKTDRISPADVSTN